MTRRPHKVSNDEFSRYKREHQSKRTHERVSRLRAFQKSLGRSAQPAGTPKDHRSNRNAAPIPPPTTNVSEIPLPRDTTPTLAQVATEIAIFRRSQERARRVRSPSSERWGSFRPGLQSFSETYRQIPVVLPPPKPPIRRSQPESAGTHNISNNYRAQPTFISVPWFAALPSAPSSEEPPRTTSPPPPPPPKPLSLPSGPVERRSFTSERDKDARNKNPMLEFVAINKYRWSEAYIDPGWSEYRLSKKFNKPLQGRSPNLTYRWTVEATLYLYRLGDSNCHVYRPEILLKSCSSKTGWFSQLFLDAAGFVRRRPLRLPFTNPDISEEFRDALRKHEGPECQCVFRYDGSFLVEEKRGKDSSKINITDGRRDNQDFLLPEHPAVRRAKGLLNSLLHHLKVNEKRECVTDKCLQQIDERDEKISLANSALISYLRRDISASMDDPELYFGVDYMVPALAR